MKKHIFLSLILVLNCMAVLAQKVTKLSDIPNIRKGTIITHEGRKIEFRNLQVNHDTVTISDEDAQLSKIPGKDVYKISKTGNSAAISAISCGLGGLLGAVVGTMNWKGDLEKSKGTFIVAATAGCALLGGIIGAFIPKDKEIYRKNQAISFYPDLKYDHHNVYASVLVRIRL